MNYNEKLTSRVREELGGIPNVVEKRMFGGVAFMVNGKLCVSVGDSRIMCRVDPAIQKQLIEKRGCQPMTMKGRVYEGYIKVDEKVLGTKEDLAYWVGLSLDFNKRVAIRT
jgi:TfoX/Sxy family transcriptional regulator of competence genes